MWFYINIIRITGFFAYQSTFFLFMHSHKDSETRRSDWDELCHELLECVGVILT